VVSIGASTYPGGQQALKNSEVASIVNTVSNATTVIYSDPTGSELSIANPTIFENPKTVTRVGGSYNISNKNFRITANRAANDATTVEEATVNIANVAAIITVSEPTIRLRSGGSDGTAPQDHTITITSDQELLSDPTLSPDTGGSRGAFIGAGFSGGPLVWTRDLRVLDTDEKGVFTWESLVVNNLAGLPTIAISGDSSYILGGFVARTLTFGPLSTTTVMSVEVADFSKLQAGIFTSTNQAAVKESIGTAPPVTNGYTIDALGVNPTTIVWLDTTSAGTNFGGTAQITNVEEVS